MKDLMTVKEVADVLRFSPHTVRMYIKSGKIKSVKIGSARRIKRTDLEALLGK